MKTRTIARYGWKPDLPDFRDHFYKDHHSPQAMMLKGAVVAPLDPTSTHNVINTPQASTTMGPDGRPSSVSLRDKMPPIYNQGQLGSCHDANTEILTSKGWVYFSDLTYNHYLATVDPKTREMIYEKPANIIKFPYKGEMICVDGQSLNFRVTPDHKMLVRKWNENNRKLNQDFEFVEAKNLGWYSGIMNSVIIKNDHHNTFILPGYKEHKQKKYQKDLIVDASAWMRFLGLYIAEGTMIIEKHRKSSSKIQIAAVKEREKVFARKIFDDLGINALELTDRFTFNEKRIYSALEDMGLLGVKAAHKFIPEFIFSLGKENIEDFIIGHFMGDGCEQNGLRSHYTSSKKLADDLQRLIFLSGKETTLNVRQPRNSVTKDGRVIIGKYPEHRISVRNKKNLSIDRSSQIYNEQYEGMVYCAEVPTYHTLVTRRNGKILISGNCTANASEAMFAFAHGGGPYSRLQLYYNSRLVEGTVGYDSGAFLRDVIQVLVNTGTGLEADWPYIESKFTDAPPPVEVSEEASNKAMEYSRLVTRDDFRNCLVQGHPFVFGATIFSSFESEAVAQSGIVPMPTQNDQIMGGHALCCVGYSTNFNGGDYYIVRNSWGSDWGDGGYCYFPAAYIENPQLVTDCWTIRK